MPKPHVEEFYGAVIDPPHKKDRGCKTPGCDWCHPGHKAPKVAVPPPVPAPPKEVPDPYIGVILEGEDAETISNDDAEELDMDLIDDDDDEEVVHNHEWDGGNDYDPHGGGIGKYGHGGKSPFKIIEKPSNVIKRMKQHKGTGRQYEAALEDWGIDNENTDPVQGAAEFYLLEGMTIDVLNAGSMQKKHQYIKMITEQASQYLTGLVTRLFPTLYAYCDMALGGELRHHRRLGGSCLPGPSHRDGAWIAWKGIREKYGTDALRTGREMFLDFASGSYGGKAWANACDVLIAYEEGLLSDFLFLDRVFNLEHNGGIFLNKVIWKNSTPVQNAWGVECLKKFIGPAHSSEPPDWAILYYFSGDEVKELWREYFEMQNAFRKEERAARVPHPRISRHNKREMGIAQRCGHCDHWLPNHSLGCYIQNLEKQKALKQQKQQKQKQNGGF